jgi:hypothetical protein
MPLPPYETVIVYKIFKEIDRCTKQLRKIEKKIIFAQKKTKERIIN